MDRDDRAGKNKPERGKVAPQDLAQTVVSSVDNAADESLLFKAGDIIDNDYKVIKLLGKGGAGQVYMVDQIKLDRKAALKLLSTNQMDETSWRRFQYEAQLIGKLVHSSIIQVYNFGIHQKQLPYYVMELVSGDTLAESIEKHGPVGASEAVDLFIDVCSALDYAHNRGIIHRDVKPANILLVRGEGRHGYRAKLLDFGIAKLKGSQNLQTQSLTVAGEVVGSPLYMSPEQCSGQGVDERSDIYSLGCTIFETLTGETPFRGATVMETVMMHFEATPPTMSSLLQGEYMPPRLEELVRRCLAKAPDDRYQSMSDVINELHAVKEALSHAAGFATQKIEKSIRAQDPDESEELVATEKKRSQIAILAGIALSVVAASVAGIWLSGNLQKQKLSKVNVAFEKGVPDMNKAPEKPAQIAKLSYLTYPVEKRGKLMIRHYKISPEIPPLGVMRTLNTKKEFQVTGSFEMPLGEWCYFQPYQVTCEHPEYLDGFDATMPNGITFGTDQENVVFDHNVTQCLKHLQQSTFMFDVSVANTTFADKDFPLLESYKYLQTVNLSKTEITAAGAAKSKIWDHIENAYFAELPDDPMPILKVLSKYDKIKHLGITRSKMTTEHVKAIAQLKSLRALDLSYTDLTDDQVAILAELPNLKGIYMPHNELLTPKSIPNFAKLKHLETINMPECTKWSGKDRQAFRDALPNTIVTGFEYGYLDKKTPGHLKREMEQYQNERKAKEMTKKLFGQ